MLETSALHVLVATGANAEGYREILGLEVSSEESGRAGSRSSGALSPGAPRCGRYDLRRPPGPRRGDRCHAAGRATWQRCRTHYLRDLLAKVPKSTQPWVATLVRTIFSQPNATEVHAQFARVVAALTDKLPDAAQHLDGARDDLLALRPSPVRWGSSAGQRIPYRLSQEIRRRTDVVGTFPDRAAAICLIGAVLAEQHDEWAEQRRYMGLEILTKVDAIGVVADVPSEEAMLSATPVA